MITTEFEYHRPSNIAAALAVLEEHGDDARVIAGGHSLIPMMKLRMAEVPHLVDLQDIVDSFFACGETSFGRRPFYPDDPVNPVYCFFVI